MIFQLLPPCSFVTEVHPTNWKRRCEASSPPSSQRVLRTPDWIGIARDGRQLAHRAWHRAGLVSIHPDRRSQERVHEIVRSGAQLNGGAKWALWSLSPGQATSHLWWREVFILLSHVFLQRHWESAKSSEKVSIRLRLTLLVCPFYFPLILGNQISNCKWHTMLPQMIAILILGE